MALRIALALCAVLVSGACLRLEDPPSSLANGLPCETDGQCEPGSVCEYDSSAFDVVCRTRDGCTGHEQCAATESCAFGACVPAECTQDAVCGAYACNEAVRQCFDACRYNSDCNAGFLCADGECLSTTCTAATAARVCEGNACVSGSCKTAFECETLGCATDYVCDGISCIRPCSSDAQCERYACFTALGECRESCDYQEHCQAGFVCRDTFCQVAP